ncbi:MAG: molybdenum cofactor biosynthesis protein A [Bacteroidetes bacterium ADurb.Bin028]|nr:MAG: molybdenum cofactor biosynthesis protein A [Bacteroidetes bacterium ADurb.Bin028]
MINKLYSLFPPFLKRFAIFFHRTLRLFYFNLTKKKSYKNCSSISQKVFEEFNQSRHYGPLKEICYAPHTSMFFSRSGLVSPCYASYNDNSSHISKNSIKDIWFSGSINEIRKQHSTCDLSISCGFCENLLNSASYKTALINKYEHYAFSKSKYPKIMEFELSNKCNLACIMCDANLSSSIEKKEKNEITENKFYKEKFFEELKEFIPHLQLAEFTGGDPFMIEEYYRIWDMIVELNPKCKILITTNANTMNPRIEELMNKHKNLNFNISIDSLEKENYEKIRVNGNFDYAIKNIQKFINYCKKNKTHLNILVCPLSKNAHELGDFVNFANKNKICVYYHTVIKPKELSLKYLAKDELIRIINNLNTYNFPKRNQKQIINKQNFENLIELLKTWAIDSEVKIESEIIEEKILSESELIDLLRTRVNEVKPEFLNKFDDLLKEISKYSNFNIILDKFFKLSDEIFFENLKNKNFKELIEICKTIK